MRREGYCGFSLDRLRRPQPIVNGPYRLRKPYVPRGSAKLLKQINALIAEQVRQRVFLALSLGAVRYRASALAAVARSFLERRLTGVQEAERMGRGSIGPVPLGIGVAVVLPLDAATSVASAGAVEVMDGMRDVGLAGEAARRHPALGHLPFASRRDEGGLRL